MTNTAKITNADRFTAILAWANDTGNADMADFAQRELDKLAKRKVADRKPTARQIENEGFKSLIAGALDTTTLRTCSEIIKLVDFGDGVEMSTQRLSPILNAMVKDNTLVKTVDKRKTYFSLAE